MRMRQGIIYYFSQDLSDHNYQSILEKTFQCENAMEQALLIQLMNLEQSNRYTDLLEEIGKFLFAY